LPAVAYVAVDNPPVDVVLEKSGSSTSGEKITLAWRANFSRAAWLLIEIGTVFRRPVDTVAA